MTPSTSAPLLSRGSWPEARRIADILRKETVGGILPGTTVRRLFDRAAASGWPTEVSAGGVADLHAAEAVWLVSGVRGAAVVHTLDGVARGDAGRTRRVRELLAR